MLPRQRISPALSALCATLVLIAVLSLPEPLHAQDATDAEVSIVSLYRIAPGQHIAFLEWMASQEAAAAEAGVPASQWYAHLMATAGTTC